MINSLVSRIRNPRVSLCCECRGSGMIGAGGIYCEYGDNGKFVEYVAIDYLIDLLQKGEVCDVDFLRKQKQITNAPIDALSAAIRRENIEDAKRDKRHLEASLKTKAYWEKREFKPTSEKSRKF